MDFMRKSNSSFMNKKCELCGRSEWVVSSVQLTCNYGSENDGEQVTLHICGECADMLYSHICAIQPLKRHE